MSRGTDVEDPTMPYYARIGDVPPKRHTQHRGGDGGLYSEELMGSEGFSADSSLLYHREIPAAISAARPWEPPALDTVANHPLRPRHLRTHTLTVPDGGWGGVDAVTGRRLLLGNADVRIGYVAAGAPSPLYRNGTGDECVYVEAGTARVDTVFGTLAAGPGDYVVVPCGTTHRWTPTGDGPLRAYVIEATSHIRPPKRYLSASGQFLEHAPYCERDLRRPAGPLLEDGTDVEVHVKHRGAGAAAGAGAGAAAGTGPAAGGVAGTVLTYRTHPFDVVGWDGCLYPYLFNIGDFEPITGRLHQPPPVHQVFEGRDFVVCNFVPRKVDYHPDAIPTPYYHANIDSDEVIFYTGGDYGARRGSGIGPGSVSLHPAGHTHGPQPGAVQASLGVEYVDELAVMVDTFAPLGLGSGGLACEDPDYAWTWAAHAAAPGGAR